MLTAQIQKDMVVAMKEKNDLKVQTLRGCKAAFLNELVAKMRKPTDELTDSEAIAVLKRLLKQRKDSADQFTAGGRPELAEKEMKESEIISAYVPQGASKEEIEKVAKAKMAELGVTDKTGIGKLTGAIMKEMTGRADGNDVKDVLSALLS